jgi:hypothetical protein
MIRINLLPEEFRRSERTAPKVFAATLAAVILVCSVFGWFSYVYFGELGRLDMERRSVEETLTSKTERANYYDALVREKKDYEKRASTIQSIGKSRILWTEILDQLLDVVNNDGNTDRHLAWFKSIDVKGGNDKNGPTIAMPGLVQGNSFQKVADFNDDVENAAFYGDVKDKTAPGGEVTTDKRRTPPDAVTFNLRLQFRPVKDWVKNHKGQKPARK